MPEGIFNHLPLWGEWQVESLIGKGSYGEVYKIYRETDHGKVYAAAKYISIPSSEAEKDMAYSKGLASDDNSLREFFDNKTAAFLKEAKLLQKLQRYPNIVGYEDHIAIKKPDGIGWDIIIRMELLEALDKYLRKNSFTQRDVVRMGIDICNAIGACHREKVIHRDVKIENIFVDNYGNFKLGDFGVSREAQGTTRGTIVGTEDYMAPEIVKHEKYNYNVDVYSIGIVMYRLLNNNRLPFMNPDVSVKPNDYTDAMEMLLSGKHKLPEPKYASGKLARIILRACAYDRSKRYATVEDMAKALNSVYDATTDMIVRKSFDEQLRTSSSGSETVVDSISNRNDMYVDDRTISELKGELVHKATGVYSGQTVSSVAVNATVREVISEDGTVAETAKHDGTMSDIAVRTKPKISAFRKAIISVAALVVVSLAAFTAYHMIPSYDGDVKQTSTAEEITVIRGVSEALTLVVGDSEALAPVVYPEDSDARFTFKSDNEAVATVGEDGTVSALSVGEAIITVTSGDVSAEVRVTVVAEQIPVESIEMPADFTLNVGVTQQMYCTPLPENHTGGTAVYNSSDPTVVAIGQDGVLTAHKPGTATITVTIDDVVGSVIVTVPEPVEEKKPEPQEKCPECGSTSHKVHPKTTCSVCGSTAHRTEGHPKPQTCSICGSTSHTTGGHPQPQTCGICGSTSHTTGGHPQPTCSTCGATGHTASNCPNSSVCGYCGSKYHSTSGHSINPNPNTFN